MNLTQCLEIIRNMKSEFGIGFSLGVTSREPLEAWEKMYLSNVAFAMLRGVKA